jgi:hypothetical protein
LLNSAPAPLGPAPIALNAVLVHDTGVSTTDHLTNDASVRGTVATAQGIADLRAGFDQTSSTNFISVMPTVQSNGSFVLDATHINQIAGGTLADGTHTLNLLAIAKAGNVKTFSLTFTLDTQSPSAPVLDLAPVSDTGVVGDHTTSAVSVTLTM